VGYLVVLLLYRNDQRLHRTSAAHLMKTTGLNSKYRFAYSHYPSKRILSQPRIRQYSLVKVYIFSPVSGATRNFVLEGPDPDVVRFQTLAILHKHHFDVTGQFLVYYNRIWRKIPSTARHR